MKPRQKRLFDSSEFFSKESCPTRSGFTGFQCQDAEDALVNAAERFVPDEAFGLRSEGEFAETKGTVWRRLPESGIVAILLCCYYKYPSHSA